MQRKIQVILSIVGMVIACSRFAGIDVDEGLEMTSSPSDPFFDDASWRFEMCSDFEPDWDLINGVLWGPNEGFVYVDGDRWSNWKRSSVLQRKRTKSVHIGRDYAYFLYERKGRVVLEVSFPLDHDASDNPGGVYFLVPDLLDKEPKSWVAFLYFYLPKLLGEVQSQGGVQAF